MHSLPSSERLALRILEVSAITGLSRSTLYKLMGEGKLRSVKAGKRRLIMRTDLESCLAGLPAVRPSRPEAA